MGKRRTLRGDPSIMKHVIDKSDDEDQVKSGQNSASGERPGGPLSLVGAVSKSNPAIAQSLKITKQKSTKKKKELPFTPSTISKGSAPKGTGRGRSGPIKSAVAGALGSSSGGSVRL